MRTRSKSVTAQGVYRYYNRKYFGGRLVFPKRFRFLKLPISKLAKTKFQYEEKIKKLVSVEEVIISTRVSWCASLARQCLLHEMIHINLLQRRKDYRCDGRPLFVREIRRLARMGAYDKLL